ncbi:MAG: adenosine kinase [Candidatus Woesearchaeota archaeon]|jgi:sugar/nucleoside kinase (ribokinase family)
MLKSNDVIGLGNALLDLTIDVEDSFLSSLNLTKGTMTLIDEEKFISILNKIKNLPSDKSTGGSASNTIKGVSLLGGNSSFMGMIGNDSYGQKYVDELTKFKIKSYLAKSTKNTGTAITFITSDGERTFATFLGASLEFSEKNINEEALKASKILHIEGFFLEPIQHKTAALKAMNIAKENNVLISVDLSDAQLISRNKDFFKEVLEKYADIVFVNETEAFAFTNLKEFDALNHLSTYCKYAIVKLGASGSIIKCLEETHNIPIHKVEVVNTNGAGDAYAAGILFGIAKKLSIEKSGRIAALISGKVVSIKDATLNHYLLDEVEEIIKE